MISHPKRSPWTFCKLTRRWRTARPSACASSAPTAPRPRSTATSMPSAPPPRKSTDYLEPACWNPLMKHACAMNSRFVKSAFKNKKRYLSYTKKQTKLACGFRLDLLVEKRIVVELKSVDALAPIQARPADQFQRFSP